MITVTVSITAEFDDLEVEGDYESNEDLLNAICAHITGALDEINVRNIIYDDLTIEGNNERY
jgi:hypothetical protein